MPKKFLKIAAGILLALFVILWAAKTYRDAHYFDNYDPRAPLNVSVIDKEEVNQETPEKGYTITKFSFDGYNGEKVPALMSVPMQHTDKKRPAIIFLHGIGQNKNFLKVITPPFNQTGFVFVSFDQFMQGDRKLPKGSPILTLLEAFRQRPGKTINETRRLIDYLQTCPDIDPQRIYLIGASYGAVMGSTVMAKDKRLRAGVLVHGGGDFGKLFYSYANHLVIAAGLGMIDGKNLDPEKTPVPTLTATQKLATGSVITCIVPFILYFLGVADPVHYAKQISPTPVFFQNGSGDMLVPPSASRALQDAAREPKKITWYNMNHVGINVEDTKRVLADGLNWLLEQDDPFRTPEEKVKELPPFEMKKT